MPKTLTKPRPQQGERLYRLRQEAGLSQYALAELIGVPQPNIAFWEQSEKPPRSDVLPRMAEALGVSVDNLLEANGAAPARAARPVRGKPTGKVRQVFEEVALLPRRQQDKVVEFVSAFVKQCQQEGNGKTGQAERHG